MQRDQIKKTYTDNHKTYIEITNELENFLLELFKDDHNIDRITGRAKGINSFVEKAITRKNKKNKYKQPFKEIQDIIGSRIVVYYKTDLASVAKTIERVFNRVEKKDFIQDDAKRFDYEGIHYICFLPLSIRNKYSSEYIPIFFELQIKTLYQHAWAQSEHGLGYKPGQTLSKESERKLAFIAAQSWGADEILINLVNEKNKTKSNILEMH